MHGTRLHLLILALIIGCGAWLRLHQLAAPQLDASELAWHFAAESASSGAGPQLPSGERFREGGPMLAVVAALQRFLENDALAARLPSAVLGIVVLPVFAAFAWLVAGPHAAIIATVLLAFFPEAVRQSRTAGLYSHQQLFGVVALASGWLATASAFPGRHSGPADLLRRWAWALVTLIALGLAAAAHLSAVTAALGFGAWVALLALAALWTHRLAAVRNNFAVQLVLFGLLAVIVALVARPDLIPALLDKARSLAGTPGVGRGSAGFYVYTLASQFGWILPLAPVVFLFVARRQLWLSLYLLLWFTIPLVIHSVAIVRKEMRLVLIAVPALLLLGSMGAAEVRAALVQALSLRLREWDVSYGRAQQIGVAVATLLLVLALVTLPALPVSLGTVYSSTQPTAANWRAVRDVLAAVPDASSRPLAGASALAAMHYLGRVDFAVAADRNYLADTLENARAHPRTPPAQLGLPFDKLSGAPVALTLQEARAAYGYHGGAFLVVASADLNSGLLDHSIRNDLVSNAEELCGGRCGDLLLYDWRMPAAPRDTATQRQDSH